MSSLRAKIGTLTYRVAAAMPLRVPPEWSPTFLIGCGRSGTTFLVSALNQHPHVLALNEPRHIWRAVDPRTDVWSPAATSYGAKVVFQRSDATPDTTLRCRRAFRWRQLISRKPQLVEKLPINNFRLGWIDAMFPTAKYINLVRHGFDVARSIEQKGASWYGVSGMKWRALQALLPHYGLQPDDPTRLDDFFQRGLLEWTLSVACNREFLECIEPARCLTIRYEDLVRDPQATFPTIFRHLDVPFTPDLIGQVTDRVRRLPGVRANNSVGAWLPHTTEKALAWYNYSACP